MVIEKIFQGLLGALAIASAATFLWTHKVPKPDAASLSLQPDALYKIILPENFDKTNIEDCIKLLPLDIKSGFIHVSFGRQVTGVIQRFFAQTETLLIIELDLAPLQNKQRNSA